MGALSRSLAGRRLLVVGGGREALPGIERLRERGAWVAVSDRDPHAPGCRAGDRALAASTYDPPGTVAAAAALHRERALDGVLCIASDVPRTVAAVARALALPGLSAESAHLATDKLAMKRALRAGGVPVPDFAAVASADELRRRADQLGFPVVVKPVDSRGARGVLRLTHGAELDGAFETAATESPTGRVMVERFVPGPQISSESFLCDGVPVTPGCADRNYELLERCAPWVIENGGLQPSRHHANAAAAIDDVIGRAAAALGISGGVLKGDLVLDPARGPVVIEVAARLSGGSFCTRTIPLSTGVDLVEAAARYAVGETVAPERLAARHWRPVANRYFLPEPGRLVAVSGDERARRLPGIVHLDLDVRPGDRIEPLTDHTRRAGSVIARGEDPGQAVARAEAAVAAVQFTVRRDAGRAA
ncbi:MAG: ATP-grasp domain-containing protein [Myxococcota bacterium]|nr:ATP-grasp domain-containing protein [Myxococcota bacterium]